jgi:N-acetyl-gamma-glutamylphosphate reductase
VAVLGASGYVGRELIGLLDGHPGVGVALATSESEPRVARYDTVPLAEAEQRWDAADLVFSCLPHGVSAPVGGGWWISRRICGCRTAPCTA